VSSVGVGEGEGSGAGVLVGGSSDVVVSSGGGDEGVVTPVPVARFLSPWCKYDSMPSRWITSSTLRADERAMRASSAKKSHEVRIVLSMFASDGNECCQQRCGGVDGSIWVGCAVSRRGSWFKERAAEDRRVTAGVGLAK
jgi:hypothetical protein